MRISRQKYVGYLVGDGHDASQCNGHASFLVPQQG
jgi:hypothetical protein